MSFFTNARITLVFFLVLISIYVYYAYSVHTSYLTQATSLGMIDQAIWQLAHFSAPITTLGLFPYTSLFSHHAEVIYYLLAPFYYIFAHPIIVIGLQGVCVGVSAWCLVLFSRRYYLSWGLSFLAGTAYLVIFFSQQFHEIGVSSLIFGISFSIIYMFLCEKRNVPGLVIVGLLALLCREEFGFVIAAISIGMFIKTKKQFLLGTAIFGICYAFSLICMIGILFHTTYHITFVDDVSQLFSSDFFNVASADTTDESVAINSLLKNIPPDASLATTANIIPHLSQRNEIYTISTMQKDFASDSPCGKPSCDWLRWVGSPSYIIVDTNPVWTDTILGISRVQLLQALQNMQVNHTLQLYFKQGDAYVYQVNPLILGDGLTGAYYSNPSLIEPPDTIRIDPQINFFWPKLQNFSIRWNGYIKSQYSEEYTIYAIRDDGIRVWIGGSLVIDRWFDHSTAEYRGTVLLRANEKTPIRIEYYQHRGVGMAQLLWSSVNTPKDIIPATAFFSH